MKVIVAFLLILCVSCGTAAAQSSPVPAPSPAPTPSPVPTATAAPDYGPCLTALAYLVVYHQHPVHESGSAGTLGELWASDGVIRAAPSFTMSPDHTPLREIVAVHCAGVLDEPLLLELTGN